MWLPKDERETLLKYYNYLQDTQEYKRFRSLSARVYIATRNLISRDLVHEMIEGGPEHVEYLAAFMTQDPIGLKGFLASSENDVEYNDITLRLTLEGYDLGRKYDSWLIWTGLWFAEYKHHWIWVIVAFAGGIIATVLAQWLSKVFT